jgi:putative transposon-encoded protein
VGCLVSTGFSEFKYGRLLPGDLQFTFNRGQNAVKKVQRTSPRSSWEWLVVVASFKVEHEFMDNTTDEKRETEAERGSIETARSVQLKVKFEVFGEEMIEKDVKSSGNSGRVYLPPDWVGHRVKIIRID